MSRPVRKKFSSLSRRQQRRRIANSLRLFTVPINVSNSDPTLDENYANHDDNVNVADNLEQAENLDGFETNHDQAINNTEVLLNPIDVAVDQTLRPERIISANLSISNTQDSTIDKSSNLFHKVEDFTKSNQKFDFKEFLWGWSLRRGISHEALTELLHGLRKSGNDNLPLSAKTLLRTPKSNTIISMGTGSFVYYGLEKSLLEKLVHVGKSMVIPSIILININVDGLSISGSSKSEIWPILGCMVDPCISQPFFIAAYHGASKPPSAFEYLEMFLLEYIKLNTEGFIFHNRRYFVCIRAFLADTPARNFIACFPMHNSRCSRCIQPVTNRRLFLDFFSELRTNENFRKDLPPQFLNISSPLEQCRFNMITQFPLDWMHLGLLGVMKRLLGIYMTFWNSQENSYLIINQLYVNLKTATPQDFSRKPRNLDEYGRWKATECRLFLLYLGPVFLRYVLPPNLYTNFMALHCAARILCDPSHCKINNSYADELLRYFVTTLRLLCGEEHMVFNVHNLLHLASDVLIHGPLDSFSVFPFENFLHTIKMLIRKGDLPLSQVMNRMSEMASLPPPKKLKASQYCLMRKRRNVQLPEGFCRAHSGIKFSDFSVTDKFPNNCVYLRTNEIVCIEFICHQNGTPVLIGRKVINSDGLDGYPCDSRVMSIFEIKELSESQAWPVEYIQKKGFAVPMLDRCYIFPIIHTIYNL